MKRWLYLAVVFCLMVPSPATAAVVWFSGLETGDLGDMLNVGGSSIQVQAVPRSGAYGLSLGVNGGGPSYAKSPTGFNLSTAYVRTYLYINSGSPPGVRQNFLTALSSGTAMQLSLVLNTDRTVGFSYANGGTIASGAIQLALFTWYLIEAKFVNAASVGGVEVKLDGVVQFSSFTTTTNSLGTIDSFGWGQGPNSCSGCVSARADDMAVSDSGYLGRGRVLTRQGTSGSPTYTAWAKNACASSLIENCWSSTPWSGTANASSAIPGEAQTMLIAPFSSTQSGHGTEVVAASDVINGCRMVVVARASAGSQMKLRHRVGGVDTDTLVNLGAGDAYFYGSIFSTTFANINAAEAGAVQFSGP